LLRTPFHNNRLLISNPKALADILVHNAYDFEKPKAIRDFLRRVLGDGLIIVEGDEHKFQRRHILPAFSFRHIRELYAVMWLKSVAMVERINAEMLEAETIEMYEWSSKATLDIIGIAALGREFNVLKNTQDELVKCYEEILEPSIEKLIYFVLTVLGPTKLVQMLPWKLNQDFKKATDSLRMICRRLVLEKRELIKTDADHHFDILSLLIKSSNFADDSMVDQMLTFLAAG
jgi:cytochrome P450